MSLPYEAKWIWGTDANNSLRNDDKVKIDSVVIKKVQDVTNDVLFIRLFINLADHGIYSHLTCVNLKISAKSKVKEYNRTFLFVL